MDDIYDTFAGFDQITTFQPEDGHRYIDAFEDEVRKKPKKVLCTLYRC